MQKNVVKYIPFGGNKVNLGPEAMTPEPEYPLLQYATGLPAQRPKLDSEGKALIDEDTGEVLMDQIYYTGFFTEVGKDKVLDDTMTQGGAPSVLITHGGGEVKRHWALMKPAVFLCANGIATARNTGGQMGMVHVWRTKRNSTASESVLYVQMIVRQLLPHYTKPFVFTVKSTQTTDALKAMTKQYKVLRRAHEALQRNGGDMDLPLWAYSLPLAASKQQEMRTGAKGQKAIYPMISLTPDEIPDAYLQRHEIPLEYVDLLKAATEKAVEWATALTERIASGVEPHEPWQQEV